jgi:glycosyltransferase involved in cell wall biosynthesis
MAVADVFLLPSENESFGLAALEAMACEVPVISSNAGGIPEVNIHGETGFLSDVGNVEEMAANAVYILSHEDVLLKFRANALAQAKRHDISIILPKYEAYYEEILKTAVF